MFGFVEKQRKYSNKFPNDYYSKGLGDLQKSSTTPKEVSKMEGMKIPQVTMGLAHTMLLVNTENEATNAKYLKMPEFTLDD